MQPVQDPQQTIETRFRAAISAAFGPEWADIDPLVRVSTNPKFGDFQANVAMSLAKRLGRRPREVAEEILAKLDLDDFCHAPEIAGPGFVNCRLLDETLTGLAGVMRADDRLGIAVAAAPKTVVVDYSAPNVAKEMHVGHLRSTIIGDAIARVLDFLGHRVVAQNHIGDWGTQFGMLIEYLLDQRAAGGDQAEGSKIADLNRFYQKAKAAFDADPEFKQRARQRVVALQGGDEETLAIWRSLVDESEKHFRVLYARLRVALTDDDIRPESSYNDDLPGIVAELEQAGICEVSEGALCVFTDGFLTKQGERLPLIIRKSDGGYLYATTDLAALRHRIKVLGADRVCYVTGAPQAQHFAMVFATARAAGWLGPDVQVEHVPFGTILGEDKKPFRTRSGEVIKLDALLDEALERAGNIVAERTLELSPEERARVADVVSIGAVKYADLSGDRVKDYVFGWDRMLAMDGNTAPYLQYAYARICSIFRRAELERSEIAKDPNIAIALEHEDERALLFKLLLIGPVIRGVAHHLEPHTLCTYLFELASQFSAFYEACPVLKAESEELKRSRLAICDLTARALGLGLSLLGIETLERM